MRFTSVIDFYTLLSTFREFGYNTELSLVDIKKMFSTNYISKYNVVLEFTNNKNSLTIRFISNGKYYDKELTLWKD